MLNAWTRPDYRDLANECRRLAGSTLSDQMKKRYLLMAKDYRLLADIDKQEHACRTEPRSHTTQMTSGRPA
jgi:hypothetical protein